MPDQRTRHSGEWTLVALISLVALTLTACASGKHNSDVLLSKSETVSIHAKIRPTDGMQAQTRNSASIAEKTNTGGGAAAGALTSLACGPAVIFCLPLFVTSGAVIGAGTHSIAGSDGDVFGLFPPKTAEQVRSVILDIETRRDFFVEMRDALASSVPSDRLRDVATANIIVYVGPDKIELVKGERTLLALRVTASLFAEWKQGRQKTRTEKRQYEYATSERPVAYWLHDDGQAFDEGFTQCIEKITQMMLWDLAPPD